MGVDSSAAAGEDVVGVGGSDWGCVAGGYLWTGWLIVGGIIVIGCDGGGGLWC